MARAGSPRERFSLGIMETDKMVHAKIAHVARVESIHGAREKENLRILVVVISRKWIRIKAVS